MLFWRAVVSRCSPAMRSIAAADGGLPTGLTNKYIRLLLAYKNVTALYTARFIFKYVAQFISKFKLSYEQPTL